MMIEKCKSTINEIVNVTKTKINGFILEYNIHNHFKEKNIEFNLYEKDSILFRKVYGFYLENNVIILGDYKINNDAILVHESDKKVYNIKDYKFTDLKILYNENEYIRKGTILFLDNKLKEVNAIKVGKKYYVKDNLNKDH